MSKKKDKDKIKEGSVYLTMNSKGLVIFYDEDRNIAMDLSGPDWDLINGFLSDVNFWAQFLTSLSGALANPGKITPNDDTKQQ